MSNKAPVFFMVLGIILIAFGVIKSEIGKIQADTNLDTCITYCLGQDLVIQPEDNTIRLCFERED